MNEHIKFYTGNSILVKRLAFLLDDEDIPSIIRDNVESARLAGFGIPDNSVELLIFSSDLDKAIPIIEKFKKEIN